MTIDQIKQANRDAGRYYFDPSTMRFFHSRVLETVYEGPGGVYFVTSERPPYGDRKYTARQFDLTTAGVKTIGPFCTLTRSEAIALAKRSAQFGAG